MEPITIIGAVALYFIFANSGSNTKSKNGSDPNYDPAIECAPGLTRDANGRCRKTKKTRPGEKVDPKEISKIKPDRIDLDDAWIGPECVQVMQGAQWWEKTMVPALLEYTDAGYGYPMQKGTRYTSGGFVLDDFAGLASAGPAPMLAGLLESYSPACSAALLEAIDLLPSQGKYQAWVDQYLALQDQWSDSYQLQNPNDPSDLSGYYDPDLTAQVEALIAKDPLGPYLDAMEAIENGDIDGIGPQVQQLISAMAKVALIRARQLDFADQGASFFDGFGGVEALEEIPDDYALGIEAFQ